jgi:UDPglucose 6-dehydrogenase
MYNITIIGFGIVGKSIGFTLDKNKVTYKYYDILNKELNLTNIIKQNNENESSFYFLCLPTNTLSNGNLDLKSMHETCELLNKNVTNNSYVIIKSTILPSTTSTFIESYKNIYILFSPEFLREENSNMDMYFSKFILLGYDLDHCIDTYKQQLINIELFEFFKFIFNHNPDILIIFKPNTILEIFKYTVNVFLATKVLFMNEIFLLTEALNQQYSDVQSLFQLEPRLGHSHLNVPHNNLFGYGGKCFIPNTISLKYLQESLDLPSDLLSSVINRNDAIKKLKND